MKIIDINGKEREAKSVVVIKHEITDVVNNKTKIEEFVEVMIKRRFRKKLEKEWYPLEEFKKLNPKLKLKVK